MLSLEHFHRLSKEGFWLILGQITAVVGSLIGVRVLTSLLDPAAYGELALGITAVMLVNQVIMGPLSNGITRFYAPAAKQKDLGRYLKAALRLVISSTGAVALIIVITIFGFLVIGKAKWAAIATASLVYAVFSSYNSILSGIQNAARQRIIVALRQGMEPWALFIIAAGLIFWLGPSSAVAMTGYVLAAVLIFITQSVFFRRIIDQARVEHQEKWGSISIWQKQILEYSWPFATWGIFLWAYMSSGKWSLQFFISIKEVGYYAVLLQLGYQPFMTLASMVTRLISPIYFHRIGDFSDPRHIVNALESVWRITVISIIGTLLMTVATFLFHKQIFFSLVAPAYAGVSVFLPIVVFSAGLLASSMFCSLGMQIQKTTRLLILPKIISYAIGTLLTFAGAARFGLTGVIYAAAFTTIIHLLWVAILLRKQFCMACAKVNVKTG